MRGGLARRYPPHSLVVSTGALDGAAASDARFPHPIDRVRIRSSRRRTVQGLALWSWLASTLARHLRPGFVWCGELKPAGYPARWVHARRGVPYGVIVYGTELLLIDAKIRRSRFKRRGAAALLGNAAVIVAISRWTAGLARSVLELLDLDDLASRIETVPLGTSPAQFRPGIDTRSVRRAGTIFWRKGSASHSSKRQRAVWRWSAAGRVECRTRCARGRPVFSSIPRVQPPSRRASINCSPIPSSARTSARRGAAPSRRTSIGI